MQESEKSATKTLRERNNNRDTAVSLWYWKNLENRSKMRCTTYCTVLEDMQPNCLGYGCRRVSEGEGGGKEIEKRFLLGIKNSCGYLAFFFFFSNSFPSFLFFIFSLSLPACSHFLYAGLLPVVLACLCGWAAFSRSSLPFASHLGLESSVRRLRFCLGHGTRTRTRTVETGGAKLKIAATVPGLF